MSRNQDPKNWSDGHLKVEDSWYWWGVVVMMLVILSLVVSQVCSGCGVNPFIKDADTPWAGWDRGVISASVDKEGEVWVTAETTFHVITVPVTISGAFRYDDQPHGRMCMEISAWIKPLCIDLPFGGQKIPGAPADSIQTPENLGDPLVSALELSPGDVLSDQDLRHTLQEVASVLAAEEIPARVDP